MAVLIRFGTSKRHTAGWLGFVSVLVVVLWIAATYILTWYFRSLADYRSVFGALASFIVLLIYLYWIRSSSSREPWRTRCCESASPYHWSNAATRDACHRAGSVRQERPRNGGRMDKQVS